MPANWSLSGQLSWLRPFFRTVLICMATTSVARLAYIIWLSDRVESTGGFSFIIVQGLRFDLVMLAYLLALPLIMTPLANSIAKVAPFWLTALKWYLVTVFGLFVFMEIATPPFIQEYDVRPNYLFVEYLKYPREILSMLLTGYRLELFAATVLLPALLVPVAKSIGKSVSSVQRNRPIWTGPFAIISLLVCVAAARSTLDHRPVNPSTVAFSSDTLVNSLAMSSLYSTLYAIYEMRHEDQGLAYGEVTAAVANTAIRENMYLTDETIVDPQIPTLHEQISTRAGVQPKNLVIIVEESLGAEFVGSLGGLPLTPNLDALSDDGIWFENLYATGTRSARGLEAIVSGFPPTNSQSVLKLGRAQHNFFTIGDYLRRKGFDTSFIYGGEAQFDNMRRFFANNGFDTVIDKHDFENPIFKGSWGVADEVVFDYAHRYFISKSPDRPFVSVLFTTTNHSPWEFPDGRIDLYDASKATVNNAVKYADFAIGRYISMARDSSYWDNTVFLIVSDHNSRVYGADLVPIERFHIPGLILGGSIKPQRWTRVASQIDLLPTLLSLIGEGGLHPAPGIDLTRSDINQIPQRAIMQYGNTQAYWQDNRVVILRRDRPAAAFDYLDGQLVESNNGGTLLDHARAVAAWPSLAYRNLQYRLPSVGSADSP